MARERVLREENGWSATPPANNGDPRSDRDYRDEMEVADGELNQSLNTLAQMFAPSDLVNRGAQ